MSTARKSLLEVQFPIAQLSLESYVERDSKSSKALSSLGKWWGGKPVVLTRAIIIGALFPSAADPEKWPEDLRIFLKLMCLDMDGMWERKVDPLPATLCYEHANAEELELFSTPEKWCRKGGAAAKARRRSLEERVFKRLSHAEQRAYCCPVERIEGPSAASWKDINSYCGTNASTLQDWIAEISDRQFGKQLKVGDAFSGMGSIPFAASALGCNVVAADLNPVACLLSWAALNVVSGDKTLKAKITKSQDRIFKEVDTFFESNHFDVSEEGWRAEAYIYCVEVEVPEWDGWKIPVSGSWEIAPKTATWIELVPNEREKRFDFKIRHGGDGYKKSKKGTKQGSDIVCPESLWNILVQKGKSDNTQRTIRLNSLIDNYGGLREWSKDDIEPLRSDFYQERLYCIRWRSQPEYDADGNVTIPSELIYREPTAFDKNVEDNISCYVKEHFSAWQKSGLVSSWRVRDGEKTRELVRTRGWTAWHQLFSSRQLLMAAEYSRRISVEPTEVRLALLLNLGRMLDANCKLCRWLQTQGGGIGGTKTTFYNQALNTFYNYAGRGFRGLKNQLRPKHAFHSANVEKSVLLSDARDLTTVADIWITDPPYADAVKYEELSEFFLPWYQVHLQECFPEWYVDSKRVLAVAGDDSAFRVSMSECYRQLATLMPDNGLQVVMFTHKDTDVWEDLALIMWSAGLQVKQVWSIATETPGSGIRDGNYVQATYNMVLRKRPADAPMGFDDIIVDQIKTRVTEVITHMRDSQLEAGNLSCGYTDTDYLLAAQAVAAEVVTGYSTISGIDLDEELRTPNRERNPDSALRVLMTLAKRAAVEFLVPQGLEEHLRRTSDATTAHTFWRHLCPEEKFLLKGLELEKGGEDRIGTFQDLGRAYGIGDYEDLLGAVIANNSRTQLPTEFGRPDMTRWEDVSASDRDSFSHSVTRHLYYAISLLAGGADSERAVKHLVDCTNFWEDRFGKHLVLLGYLYQTTEPIEAWNELRPIVQTLRLAVENHRA